MPGTLKGGTDAGVTTKRLNKSLYPERSDSNPGARKLAATNDPLKRLKDSPFQKLNVGFPGGAVVENPPANAGDTGSSPGLGGSHMPRSN